MIRYYGTTDNLGGAIGNLLYTKPVTLLSAPDPTIEIVSGYTNNYYNTTGYILIGSNGTTLDFNGGEVVQVTQTGTYILFNNDFTQQVVVNVLSIPMTLVQTTIDFTLPRIINDLFDPISTQQAIDSSVRYRCIALKNESINALTFTGGKIWIKYDVSEGQIDFGFDPCGVNGTPTTKTEDDDVPPTGVNFYSPTNEGDAISIPTLNYGDVVYLWIRRSNPVGTTENIFEFTLEQSGTME